MLVHWPIAYSEVSGELFPKDTQGNIVVDDEVDFMETWSALEECVRAGKIRSIGLSNFSALQVQRVIDEGQIRPVALQVEMNPYFQQRKLAEFCRRENVILTAYTPLLNTQSPFHRVDDPNVFTDPVMSEIASTHGMTNAQVALRFLGQGLGAAVITKSVNAGRIRENLGAFKTHGFDLTLAEIQLLEALDRGESMRRVRPLALNPTSTKYFPFD